MKVLSVKEINTVSGGGLIGALNLATSSAWAGSILGGHYGGSNGGILGFGIIGNLVGLVGGGIFGALGGLIRGITQTDQAATGESNVILQSVLHGTLTK